MQSLHTIPSNNGSGYSNEASGRAVTNLPGPGILVVTSSAGFSSSGRQGGPFSPASQTYTLQNTGGSSLNWTASRGGSWVTLSANSGTLAAGATTNVTVSINGNGNTLSVGSYSDTITFRNTTNGNGNTSRSVSLTVVAPTPGPGVLELPRPPVGALLVGKEVLLDLPPKPIPFRIPVDPPLAGLPPRLGVGLHCRPVPALWLRELQPV